MDRMDRIKGMRNDERSNDERSAVFNSAFRIPHSSLVLILSVLSILV
jgi:hypothetical protein